MIERVDGRGLASSTDDEREIPASLEPIGLPFTLACFALPATGYYFATHYGIAWVNETLGLIPALTWYLTGILSWFGVMLVLALVFVTREQRRGPPLLPRDGFFVRVGMRPMTRRDWAYALAGTVAGVLGMGISSTILTEGLGQPVVEPGFMGVESLGPDTRWVLGVWLVYMVFNILGEELFWHGYLQRRQVATLGRWAWVVNGLLWTAVHMVMGWTIALVVLPLCLVVSFVLDRTDNLWTTIFIHGVIGLVGDIGVMAGVVQG